MSALLRLSGAPTVEVELLGRPARLALDLNALARLEEEGSSLEQLLAELQGARRMRLVPLLLWATLASDEACGLTRADLGRLGPSDLPAVFPVLMGLLSGSAPRPPTAPETSSTPAP